MKVNKEKYRFKSYNKAYPQMFKKEKAKITKVITGLEIEHVGSTSVPGLGGKGIIDIAIKTPIKKASEIVKKLESLGYESDEEHKRNNNRIYLKKVIYYKGKERRIHVHLTLNKRFWNSFIIFRDYLRNNQKAKETYARIKKEGAVYAQGEAEKYRTYKKALLEKIMRDIA